MIDLRSDTLTQPTPEMRQAMASAPVGDDVFSEDPTVNELQDRVAKLLGKEAALLVPSGTMGNQLGVRLHCGAGDEFICDLNCHIFQYEQVVHTQLFGISANVVETDDGMLTPSHLTDRIRPDSIHTPATRLVCLENTHNRLGGRLMPLEQVAEVCTAAKEKGLARHLDGARLWNAAVATGTTPADWAQHFDTISVCFSKGLGAPVGSAIVGTLEHIEQARRHRKALGGGMRQAGILAAAALYALDHQYERLAEDHQHAAQLAEAIRQTGPFQLVADRCDTNLVLFDIDPTWGNADRFLGLAQQEGLLALDMKPHRIRLVTHLDVDEKQVDDACQIILELA